MDLLEVTFLGTASAYPSPTQSASCIALRTNESIWLFDCGEGSQIQLMRSQLKAGKINKIFITHLHGDHLFGLPGLLCTLSQNRERSEAVEVYGPVGLRHYLCTSLACSRSDLQYSFSVIELQTLPCQAPPDFDRWPIEVQSKIPFHPLETPGRLIEADENETWHLYSDSKISVKAVWVKHRIPSFTYVIDEAERVGKLDVNKLKELGVKPGPQYSQLKAGKTITLEDGTLVKPENVLGPCILGRQIVISGDSCDSSQLFKLAQGATLLVHETTLENEMEQQCIEKGHSTPGMTATLAKKLDVHQLILTHFSQRYKPVSSKLKEGEVSVQKLLDEALEILPPDKVMAAYDFMVFTVPRR